jgi:hypothetical protein
VPVRSRVGHQEQDVTGATIANLERNPPLERLAVGQSCLGLDAHRPSSTANFRVPRPEVALDGEWYFCAPAKPWLNHLPKALQERTLCSISQRISAGIRPNGQLKTHDGAAGTDELDRRISQLSSLQPTDVRVRSTDCLGDEALAQSGTHASIAHVGSDASQRGTDSPLAAVGRTFTGRHAAEWWQPGLFRRSTGDWLQVAHPMFQAAIGIGICAAGVPFLRQLEHPMFRPTAGRPGRGLQIDLLRQLEHPAFQALVSHPSGRSAA